MVIEGIWRLDKDSRPPPVLGGMMHAGGEGRSALSSSRFLFLLLLFFWHCIGAHNGFTSILVVLFVVFCCCCFSHIPSFARVVRCGGLDIVRGVIEPWGGVQMIRCHTYTFLIYTISLPHILSLGWFSSWGSRHLFRTRQRRQSLPLTSNNAQGTD